MTTKKLGTFLGIFCFAALGASINASAQQTVVKSKHGAWNVQCEAPTNPTVNAADLIKDLEKNKTKKKQNQPLKAAIKEQCGMVQIVKSTKRPNVGLSIIIFRVMRKDKSAGGLLRVLAPAGVFLPTGLAMEIDGKAQGRIGFLRCLPNGCLAQADITKKLMKAFRKGKAANFIIYEAPGRGLALKVPLKGFTAAFKALKS